MEKLNKFGYTKVELLVIVVLVGIVAFITLNQASYTFAIDNTDAVNDVIGLIEMQAKDYAMDNLNLFDKTETTYITVNDLVDKSYLIGDDKGQITSPADSSITYNDNKVKLEYNKEKKSVVATLIS